VVWLDGSGGKRRGSTGKREEGKAQYMGEKWLL